MATQTFQFLETGPLIDRELELVPPTRRWLPDVVAACRHPLTRQLDTNQYLTSEQHLNEFLKLAPGGRQPGDAMRAPSYHFWMRWRDEYRPPVRMAGGIGLRIGHSSELELYSGHIGYHVYPPARGRHFAERSCRLLFDLARRHEMTELWITCNPDNAASRRTCERLGAEFIETVLIPPDHPFYIRGERAKCRYLLRL